MTLFKCKMCGGTLNISRSETVATCEYCGTQQTLPKLNEDRKINLYDRANHFRRNNEFDKATDMYEQILNEDNTDAEAYWSLVLCRFGIEYVEDPTSHKRIPTVNRAQFTSVFDDDNYKSALQHADIMQRRIYEEEATIINDIQKGILAISQKADPFDIFICYKESDSNGKRTPDSVLAQELYYQLKQEGFRVFFSRITLEDKLGSAYEPYIFAALNSAKVMVVLGTKPEFFNAVWVKNEWSRYLALIKKGQKKTLIPAYKDMDPYDLPEEFSHLQAQDMSKLGFMQDLIRGIKKIIKREDPKPGVYKTQTVREAAPSISGTTDAGILPILKRAFLFLEDGNWVSANEYCEKVLDRDPENAQAYLGKLMVELHVRRQEELEALPKPFDQYGNYQKAIRFGDENLRATLTGYVEHINTRNETARLEEIYGRAMREMRAAKNEATYQNAAQLFKSVSGYKNADILADQCQTKAEETRKDAILASAEARMESSSIANQERAIALLQSIPGWKDADRLVTACQQRIEQIKAKAEADRIERVQRAQIFAKRAKKATLITAPVCLLIALAILLHSVIIPNVRYNSALALMEEGKYEEAISKFEKLDDFKDSAQKIAECNQGILEAKYTSAIELMKAGKYEEAKALFLTLKDFKQSAQMIRDCELMPQYHTAVQLMNENKYGEALPILEALGDYRDCTDRIKECIITLYGQEIWYKVADVAI